MKRWNERQNGAALHGRSRPAALWAAGAALCLLLSGCSAAGSPSGDGGTVAGYEGDYEPIPCTRADLDTGREDAAEIDLSQAEAGYTITDAGDYVLTGRCDGSICVDAEEQIVHLILDNADICSLSGPAIHIKSAGKVILTLADGSANTVQDDMHHRGKDQGDAAIYSECDLTVNGGGSLKVLGSYEDGIHSKDIVKLLGGDIEVTAKNNAVQGNDGIVIRVSSLAIECEGNGLRTTKTGKEEKGTVDISGGRISVIAGEYGVSSANDLYMRGCSFWSNAVLGQLNIAGKSYVAEGCMENG